MRSIVALALLVLAPPALRAQHAPADTLTLAGAVALARAHHPAIAAAAARRHVLVGRARQDAAFTNPTFEWRRENLGSPLDRDEFATVLLPIDLTGRHLALRGAVRSAAGRAAADSQVVAREVEAGAARAYWRAALARELLASATVQRDAAERIALFTSARARDGAVAGVDATRMRVERQRARLAEGAARAEWERARAELSRATGVSADSLPPPAPLAPETGALAVGPEVSAAQAIALVNRPELAALRATVAEARQRATAESRGVLGDVVLQFGIKHTAGYDTRVVGVAVPLPLFDLNSGARERAAGELRVAEAELRAAELAVRAEVAGAVASYRELLATSAGAGDALLAQGDEVARVAEAAYREGGTSLLELLEAQRARAELRSAALRWSADVRLARLELARATGAPLVDSLEAP